MFDAVFFKNKKFVPKKTHDEKIETFSVKTEDGPLHLA